MNKLIEKKTAGVAIVEFAIILPLLLLMLYGITEIGRMIYQQNTLYKGLMAGSRYMARAEDIIELNTDETPALCTKTGNYTNYQGSADSIEKKTKELIVSSVAEFPGFSEADITIDVPETAEDLGDDVVGCKIRIVSDAPFKPLFVPFFWGDPSEADPDDLLGIHAEIEERYIGL